MDPKDENMSDDQARDAAHETTDDAPPGPTWVASSEPDPAHGSTAADASEGAGLTAPDAPPTSTPAFRTRPVSRGVASMLAVLLVVASGAGYLIGRRKSTSASTSSASTPVAIPAFNSTGGDGASFGGNFGGGLAPATGTGSSSSASSSDTTSATAQKVAALVDPAIVDVTATLSDGTALGTGMVVSSDGEILTNYHVISGATSVHVRFVTSGESYSAAVVGYDATHDVALLKIDVSGLTTIATSSTSVDAGTNIVVIGNAYGQGGTPAVVDGVVAATNKTITASDEGNYDAETLNGLVELSANVVSGDSGGAVADTHARVIAMTTAASAGNGTAVSYSASDDAYAIPISTALSIVHEIANGEASSTVHLGQHGLLGVGVQDANTGGAQVAAVEAGSAAAKAGIVAGDTITAVNGTSVTSTSALDTAMAATHIGDHITVQWKDTTGSSHEARATLADGIA